MRLQTFIKNNANKTKSEVIKLFHEGRIKVNGRIIPLPTELDDNDLVTIDDQIIDRQDFVYYAYNKPIGIECTNDLNKKNNIRNHLNLPMRVYTVGRLDKASHGLIFLTNSNEFCDSIIGKNSQIEKEYIVTTRDKIDDNFINNITKSVVIRNKETKECSAYLIDDYHFKIILREGMYHQIRKMVIMNGNRVIDLFRIRIGNINIFDLNIKEDELRELNSYKEE